MHNMKNIRNDLEDVDLESEISKLVSRFPNIKEISLFGSRAYETNSVRSDIDLLLKVDKPIPMHLYENLYHNALDLFETTDYINAKSYHNGSTTSIRAPHNSLVEQLDVKLLWKDGKFDFDNINNYGIQLVSKHVDFKKTILPYAPFECDKNIPQQKAWGPKMVAFLLQIAEIINIAMEARNRIGPRGKNISKEKLVLKDEYDFQNYIYIALKPFFRDLGREPFAINLGDREKYADFALNGNRIVIEAKYIKDSGSRKQVLDAIPVLKTHYRKNPTIAGLLFIVLFERAIDIDKELLRSEVQDDSTVVCFIENISYS